MEADDLNHLLVAVLILECRTCLICSKRAELQDQGQIKREVTLGPTFDQDETNRELGCLPGQSLR